MKSKCPHVGGTFTQHASLQWWSAYLLIQMVNAQYAPYTGNQLPPTPWLVCTPLTLAVSMCPYTGDHVPPLHWLSVCSLHWWRVSPHPCMVVSVALYPRCFRSNQASDVEHGGCSTLHLLPPPWAPHLVQAPTALPPWLDSYSSRFLHHHAFFHKLSIATCEGGTLQQVGHRVCNQTAQLYKECDSCSCQANTELAHLKNIKLRPSRRKSAAWQQSMAGLLRNIGL